MSREKHSKARLDGICDYRCWTTEELIDGYMFENGRGNAYDARVTQEAIRTELERRFSYVFRMMDSVPHENAEIVYRYLLHVDE